MTVRYYTSTAEPTTLSLNATAASTVIDVVSLVGYPGSFPYTICLDFDTPLRELVQVDNAAGTTLTVTRGVDGTSAVDHSAGATVRHVSSARDFADSRTHENSTMGVHGVSGAVVGNSDIQTLTNKTLTSPTITGTVAGGATYTGATLTSPTITTPTFSDATFMPSGAAAQAVVINANASQSADLVRINDKSGDKRTWIDSGGTLNLMAESSSSALQLRTKAATPAGESLVEGYDTSSNLVFFVGNGGSLEPRPRNAENGCFVNSPTGYTGNAFLYQKNAVTLFQVSNDGSITTASDLSVGDDATITGDLTVLGAFSATGITTGAWNSWTPTFTASGGGFSLGNGTLTARYATLGKVVHIEITLVRGTTTSFGTGNVSCNLPFNANHTGSKSWVFAANLYDAAANLPYPATAVAFDAGGGTSSVDISSFKAGAAGRLSGSGAFPFTWAGNTNASIVITGTYEQV